MHPKIIERRSGVLSQIFSTISNDEGDKVIQVTYNLDGDEEVQVNRLENRTFSLSKDKSPERLKYKGGAHAFLCTLIALEKLAGNINDNTKISVHPAYITGGSTDITELVQYYNRIGFTERDEIGIYKTTVGKFLEKCFEVKPSEELKTFLNNFRSTFNMQKSPPKIILKPIDY
jgi:hypothetical protein